MSKYSSGMYFLFPFSPYREWFCAEILPLDCQIQNCSQRNCCDDPKRTLLSVLFSVWLSIAVGNRKQQQRYLCAMSTISFLFFFFLFCFGVYFCIHPGHITEFWSKPSCWSKRVVLTKILPFFLFLRICHSGSSRQEERSIDASRDLKQQFTQK